MALRCGGLAARWLLVGGAAMVLGDARAAAQAPEGADTFDACAVAFQQAPRTYDASLCFYLVAARTGAWEEGARRLGALRDRHPDIPWLALVLGYVVWSTGDESAADLYRTSARAFASAGDLHGELLARSNLRTLLFRTSRLAEAEEQVRRIAVIGELAEDPVVRVRALVNQASHQIETGSNLSGARNVLLRARAVLDDEHPYWMHKEVFNNLGLLSLHFGQYEEAASQFQLVAKLARGNGDVHGAALATFNLANAVYEMQSEMPRAGGRQAVEGLARDALAAAHQVGNARIEVLSHRLLAELLMHQDPEQARGHLAQCQAIATERLPQPGLLSQCLWHQARLAASEPDRGRALIAQAVALIDGHDDPALLGLAWRHQMRLSWETEPLQAAIANGQRALGVFESLRDMQLDEGGRTQVLAAWARDYYWLSGRLLERAEADERPGLVAEAFSVTERMRARALLEALDAQGSSPLAPPTPARAARGREHKAVLEDMVELNRQLLAASDGAMRQSLLDDLAALELREEALRPEVARSPAAPSASASTASLADVRAALEPGEALLSYQIAPWQEVNGGFGGGAWLVAATRDAVQVRRLPGRTELSDSAAVMLGLQRAGRRVPQAESALHRRLLGPVLDELSPGIRRLIVVPDYPLHQLPLASLRAAADAPALGTEFEVAFVPSATVWLRWRQNPGRPAGSGALVFANPSIVGQEARAASWRSWAAAAGVELGMLPYAEAEGHAVIDRLGPSTMLLTAAAASEAALKAADLSRFGIIHFATHTVVDEAHPDRSAILLAPGDSGEDGLLQPREIAGLPLKDKLIVLSSCQSATGTHVRGEGVQGLARAFFAAGAESVIGSLWPMRDDEAKAFFDAFYRAMAAGQTVFAAHHSAQRELERAGFPVSAWAGFLLLGDGDRALEAKPASAGGSRVPVAGVLAIAAGLTVAAWWLWRARFVRRRSAVR